MSERNRPIPPCPFCGSGEVSWANNTVAGECYHLCRNCKARGPTCSHGSEDHSAAHWRDRRSDELRKWLKEQIAQCEQEAQNRPIEKASRIERLVARREAFISASNQAATLLDRPVEPEDEQEPDDPLMKWLRENWRQGRSGMVKLVMLNGEPVAKHEGKDPAKEVTVKSGGGSGPSLPDLLRLMAALKQAEENKDKSGKASHVADPSLPSLMSLLGMLEGKEFDISAGFQDVDPAAAKKQAAVQSLLKDVYDAIHRGEGPMAGSTDKELGGKINDQMSNLLGSDWRDN